MKLLLLDVDGVVADFIRGMEEKAGFKFTEEQLKTFYCDRQVSPTKRSKIYEIARDPSFWESLPLIEGAKEGLRHLNALGYKITWVTSPWKGCEGWEEARKAWLNKHFDIDRMGQEVKVMSDKSEVDGDIFIDDKVDNIRDWKKNHSKGRAYIYDAPSNKNFHNAPRFTWGKVKELL